MVVVGRREAPACPVVACILGNSNFFLCFGQQGLRGEAGTFFFNFILKLTYFLFQSAYFLFFVFGCARSSLLYADFLQLWQAGTTLELWIRGFVLCWLLLLRSTGSRAFGLQQYWPMGSVAPGHLESSWTRDQTCAACIGR